MWGHLDFAILHGEREITLFRPFLEFRGGEGAVSKVVLPG
jgi:hypothetical protein